MIVLMVLPIVYAVAGMVLTDISDYDDTQGTPLSISAGAYEDLYSDGSVYTFTNRTGQ